MTQSELNTLEAAELARLRWRTRRGLLENDLLLTRFLDQYATTLSADEIDAFSQLLELPDQELLTLLLEAETNFAITITPQIEQLLIKIRRC